MAARTQRWSLFHSALGVLILTYIWRIQDIIPLLSKLQVVSLATLGAMALFIISGYVTNLGFTTGSMVFRLALFVVALMIASIPAGIYVSQSFYYFLNDFVKTFLVFVLIACGVRGIRNIERLLLLNIAGAFIYGFFSIRHGELIEGRLAHLIYYDANDLGMLIVCTIPFCVYFLRPGVPLMRKLLALSALPVLLLAFVRTGSRGAFLGLLAVGAFMLFRFTAISRTARIATVAAAVIAMVGYGGDQYLGIMKSLLNLTTDYNWVGNQDTGRMEVWKRGIGYMLRRPVLGVGVNNFYVAEGTMSERGRQQQFGRGFKWSAAHNSFVQIGAELGVFGLAAFVAMLYNAFRTTSRPPPLTRNAARTGEQALGQAFAASLIGFAVTAFFLSQAYGAFLYTLLAMTVAYDLSRTREQPPKPPLSRPVPSKPIGRGGLIRSGAAPSPSLFCVCGSVSVCVCGASYRAADRTTL